MPKFRLVGICLAATALVAACGSSDKPADSETTTTTAASTTTMGDMDGMDHGAHDHEAGEHDNASGDDKGLGMLHNGHHEEMHYETLDAATQAKVDKLVELSREVAAKYPTLGELHAAGGRNAGPFSPGLGLHVTTPWAGQGLNPDGVVDEADASHPLIMIYDGTDDDAKVAGFMYYSVAEEQPEGFPGPNDFWHYHTDVCTKFTENGTEAPFGADRSTTKEQCDKVGGNLMAKTQWMAHVWSIDGYEVPEKDGGMFAEVNAKLDCSDGTYYMMDPEDWVDHPLNFCKSEL